jgi:malonate decarboxylase acyl carrier protein
MEQITLSFPASRALSGKALAGVVGSGDMEVLFTAGQSETLNIDITTSVDNSQARWNALFEPSEPDQRPARRTADHPRFRRHAGRRAHSY